MDRCLCSFSTFILPVTKPSLDNGLQLLYQLQMSDEVRASSSGVNDADELLAFIAGGEGGGGRERENN